MKIALIGPVYPYRGGISHYTTMLARALAIEHELQVISFRRQYPSWLYPGKSDKDPSQKPIELEAQFLLEPLNPWSWWRTYRRIMDSGRKAVLFQWWTTFWAPAIFMIAYLLRRKKVNVLFLIHNVLPHEPHPWDIRLARMVLGQADAFIVQTSSEEQRLAKVVSQGRPVRISPHPVYDMFSNSRVTREEACHRLNLSPEKPVILFFGIVREYKGLSYLLEALALLREQFIPAQLLIAGEFWESQSTYDELILKLKLTDLVTIENRYIPNEELSIFFSAADVFTAPYIGGTQSGAVKMALGFRLPLVITSVIADEEILTGAFARTLIVPPRDSVQLAEAIAKQISPAGPKDTRLLAREQPEGQQEQNGWRRMVFDIDCLLNEMQDKG